MSVMTVKGGRNSTSFITVAEADQYLAGLPYDTTEWTALTTAQKEYRLELAAQALGLLPWKGRQTYCGQALCWPRSVYQQGIPEEVKESQAAVAYSVIHRGLAQIPESPSEDSSMADVKSVSLGGVLSVTFASGGVSGGTLLDGLIRSIHFSIFMRLKRWLSQFRGGVIRNTDDDDYPTCSTTTTTTSTTSTTTTTTTTSTT